MICYTYFYLHEKMRVLKIFYWNLSFFIAKAQLFYSPENLDSFFRIDISNFVQEPEYHQIITEWLDSYFKRTNQIGTKYPVSRTYFLTSHSVHKILSQLFLSEHDNTEFNKDVENILSAKESTAVPFSSKINSTFEKDSKRENHYENSVNSTNENYLRENNSRSPYERIQLPMSSLRKKNRRASLTVSGKHMAVLLKNVFNMPRNHEVNDTLKDAVRIFLSKKFYDYGLLTALQTFISPLFENMFEMEAPLSYNIIGISPGRLWGTKMDKILLVGGHYDTVPLSSGYNDNGSGIAALLESIRVFYESRCTFQYSVIFVAFDLEEYGSHGSFHFINDFLVPKILVPFHWPQFQGAIILDSIMNFNESVGSQIFPPEWAEIVPEIEQRVRKEEFKGNFQTVLSRKSIDDFLSDSFIRNWNEISKKDYLIEKFDINLPAELPNSNDLIEFLNLLRSDHSRFWYPENISAYPTLNAILISDTGPYRGIMIQCYHKPCDGILGSEGFQGNISFLVKTTQTLVNTVKEIAGAKCLKSSTETRYENNVFYSSDTIPYSENVIEILEHWNKVGIL